MVLGTATDISSEKLIIKHVCLHSFTVWHLISVKLAKAYLNKGKYTNTETL